jgi:ATP-dependent Clp protease protease subunit
MNEVIAHHTGQTVEKVEQDTDRDNFMSPDQAKEYGIIDTVLGISMGEPAKDIDKQIEDAKKGEG